MLPINHCSPLTTRHKRRQVIANHIDSWRGGSGTVKPLTHCPCSNCCVDEKGTRYIHLLTQPRCGEGHSASNIGMTHKLSWCGFSWRRVPAEEYLRRTDQRENSTLVSFGDRRASGACGAVGAARKSCRGCHADHPALARAEPGPS